MKHEDVIFNAKQLLSSLQTSNNSHIDLDAYASRYSKEAVNYLKSHGFVKVSDYETVDGSAGSIVVGYYYCLTGKTFE